MNTVTVPIAELTDSFPTLTGVARARIFLGDLIRWTAEHNPRGTLLLDFRGVGPASASFLRESVLAFRDYARMYQPEVFPVAANMDADLCEEFTVLLRQRGEAMLGCSVDGDGVVSAPVILGSLEPGLQTTLEAVRERGALTPADLRKSAANINPSTWSNRLASLVRQGFVVAVNEGNRREYRFVLASVGGEHGD